MEPKWQLPTSKQANKQANKQAHELELNHCREIIIQRCAGCPGSKLTERAQGQDGCGTAAKEAGNWNVRDRSVEPKWHLQASKQAWELKMNHSWGNNYRGVLLLENPTFTFIV